MLLCALFYKTLTLVTMKNKIQTREDIIRLVDTFYRKAIHDPLIGHFFTEVVHLDWDLHMPTMYDFWETVLLDQTSYKGNPILKHIELDQKARLTPAHFERWLTLWRETVHELFTGEKAEEAVKRAEMIRQLMQYKVEGRRETF